MDLRIEFALTFMKDNLETQLSVSQMARRVNLSDSRFSHLFAAETGTSPKLFIRKLRLDRAKELLDDTRLSIDQIVLRVGWRDRSHFERLFREVHGVTPALYRVNRQFMVPSTQSQDGGNGHKLAVRAIKRLLPISSIFINVVTLSQAFLASFDWSI